jgi:hypothetical protein
VSAAKDDFFADTNSPGLAAAGVHSVGDRYFAPHAPAGNSEIGIIWRICANVAAQQLYAALWVDAAQS